MRKIYVVSVALIAALALAAIGSASASATTLQWLANGKAITTGLSGKATGELTLGSTNGLKLKIEDEVLCSWILVIEVDDEGGVWVIIEWLDLSGEKVSLTAPLLCASVKTCEGTNEVEPVNLPWLGHLELMGTEAEPLFLAVLEAGNGHTGEAGNPGWSVSCKTALGTVTETCTVAGQGLNVTNDATENDVLGVFEHEATPPATCSVGGANTGFFESGTGDEAYLFVLTNGDALSASYE